MVKNHRILIVDDNLSIHEDFAKILGGGNADDQEFDAEEAAFFGRDLPAPESRGAFELSFASQGSEALELVRESVSSGRRYAMVFTDVRMPPGWDGLETTLKLWEADPDMQVVICTAYSDKSWEEMMDTLKHPERVLILKKPFDTIEVLQLAHALTEKWSLLQSARRNADRLEQKVGARMRDLQTAYERLARESTARQLAEERLREQAARWQQAEEAMRGLKRIEEALAALRVEVADSGTMTAWQAVNRDAQRAITLLQHALPGSAA